MLRKRKNTRQQYKETNYKENDDGERKFNLLEQVRSERFESLRDRHLLELTGSEVTLKLIQRNGFEKPILVTKPQGLDLVVPSKSFQVRDVRNYVGHDRIIDVMDVKTQKNIEMSMRDWCKYYESRQRDRLLNVISLEFSHTKLDELVESPLIVRLLDWVDLVWPSFLKQSQIESTNTIDKMKYPKVQKYCLMSVKGSYTDFHIDFGGTSVWYHILRGRKIFWMVPPTELNLQIFEEWTLSGMQQDVFFGDTVEECFRVELCAGNTFFIPSGWIHAVYTLEDSLVFGGNFLHSFGIENQLKVSKIEDATKVPHKFRYPFYTEILWYAVQHYVYCLTDKDHLHRHELEAAATKEKELAEAALMEKNNKLSSSTEIEDDDTETNESEHEDSDNNNNNSKNKKKKASTKTKTTTTSTTKTTTTKKGKKRTKPAPKRSAPAKKKKKNNNSKKKPLTDDDEDEDDDATDIDSSNEEITADKSKQANTKSTTNTCRMTKNSLLRLQYEVEAEQEKRKQLEQSSSTDSKSPSKKKTSESINNVKSSSTSLNSSLAQQKTNKQLQIASTTVNLAEIMLSQNESKLNGWSSVSGSGQSIWSNPSSESKEPPKIHITKYEVSGLKVLVKYLSKLSGAKKNLPNLIRNSRALLDDCRKLIAEHENDDPELAITGKPITPELLRKPKRTDMNELIGQFFKQSTETTGIDDIATSNNKNNSHAILSSPSKNSNFIKVKPELKSAKTNSASHTTLDVDHKSEDKKTSVNNSLSINDNSSSLKSSLSPHKETKCLSPNKKLSSTATSSSNNNNNSTTTPPRPKSPPTRPLSNNQYTSKTTKQNNNNLLLPGSFADLIAATSTEKKVFDVSSSGVNTSLLGTKDLASPTKTSQKHPNKNKDKQHPSLSIDLKSSPLDILTSPLLTSSSTVSAGGTSSNASSGSGAGAGNNTTSNKEALQSPNFSNNDPTKSATNTQGQKRFINPNLKPPQHNKEKLIYASAPYISPVNTNDLLRPPNHLYPWQTPNPNQQHHLHHNQPHQHPHPHSSNQHQQHHQYQHQHHHQHHPPHLHHQQQHQQQHQHQHQHNQQHPSTYSPATATKHSTQQSSSHPSNSIAKGESVKINAKPSYSDSRSTANNQLQTNLISLQKKQHSGQNQEPEHKQSAPPQPTPLPETTSKQPNNKQSDVFDQQKVSSNKIDASSKKLSIEQSQNQSNNNRSSSAQPSASSSKSSSTNELNVAIPNNSIVEDTEQKTTKKASKPRAPPKKSKEARQVIEQQQQQQQDATTKQLQQQQFLPISVIRVDKSSVATSSAIIDKPIPQIQIATTTTHPPQQADQVNKRKTKKQKKSKEPAISTQLQPQAQQQHHLLQSYADLQQQIKPQTSVICIRPPLPQPSSTTTPTTNSTLAGVTPRLTPQQYMITRPLLFNTMPTFSSAQFQQMPRNPMPLFTTPISSQFPGLPFQQGARIVWATPPRGLQQPGTPLVATTTASVSGASITKSNSSAITSTITTTPAGKNLSTLSVPVSAHQGHQDNTALLSLATTALSTAPMASSPALSQLNNRMTAPQAVMVSSAPNQSALFAAPPAQFFRPYLQRMPVTQYVTQPGGARPTTGQLVFARLPPNQSQPRYLITQPGFMQQRFQPAPHLLTNQPTPTLAYATFKNPATESTKTIKKKIKTN